MLDAKILENRHVRLEPIDSRHVPGLWKASTAEIWDFMPVRVATENDMRKFLAFAQQCHENGQGLAYCVLDSANRDVIGSTGFWNYVAENKRVEIGFTWYTPQRQRTAVNTSCKLLLLTHAFETLGLNRVEFKTDSLNLRSQKALSRLGAKEEGTLRNHVVQPDGRLRHSVYFSVIKNEWPEVKERLQGYLID